MRTYRTNDLRIGISDNQLSSPKPGEALIRVGSDGGMYAKLPGEAETPIGGGAATPGGRHTNTWTIDPNGSGDFSTGDELMASPLVLDNDRVNITHSATFATYTKVLHIYLYNSAFIRLPNTINVDVYITGAQRNYGVDNGISVYGDITINGNLYLSDVMIVPITGDPSTRTIKAYGDAELRYIYNQGITLRYYGTGHFNVYGLYSSGTIIGDATGTGSMVLNDVRCGGITRAAGTSTILKNVESTFRINFTGANSHTTLKMWRVDCTNTMTLPATVSGTDLRYVTADTLTAPSAITGVTSKYGIYGAKTNVTFTTAGLNIVGTTIT